MVHNADGLVVIRLGTFQDPTVPTWDSITFPTGVVGSASYPEGTWFRE